MSLMDKVFRMVTHRFYESHPCHSYTWFHKGYRYTISRFEDTELWEIVKDKMTGRDE